MGVANRKHSSTFLELRAFSTLNGPFILEQTSALSALQHPGNSNVTIEHNGGSHGTCEYLS